MITIYAQNFEDVYLWRALGDVENGRYVDVGAHDPDDDSVTRLFYERGWRGINIEPVPTMAARLLERRPEDVVVRAACGDHEGEVTLYEVVGTGLSTLEADHAEDIRAQGRTVVAHPTPLVTLNSLFEEYGGDPVHFLKIDVEGAERSVLSGCDFERWRPWVLVIEATIPMSREVNDQTWEGLVTGARYEKAFFDGLNNYYVAEEHPELKSAFTLPPNFFDDFMLPITHGRVEKHEINGLRQNAATLTQELDGARAFAGRLEELVRSTEDWAKSTEARLQLSEKQAALAQAQATEAHAAMRRMSHSISWNVTAPLRVAAMAARASARFTVPSPKDVARPVLRAGVRFVRNNPVLLRTAKKVVSTVRSTAARAQGFVSATRDEQETM
jgi:FkbM family methyltransferase